MSEQPISPLLADIVTGMFDQAAKTSNELQRHTLVSWLISEESLIEVRERITELCSNPHAPNPSYILMALWPDQRLMRMRAENRAQQEQPWLFAEEKSND